MASKASGSVRDAEKLLGQAISFTESNGVLKTETLQIILGTADKAFVFKFLEFLQQKKASLAFELLSEMRFSGVDLKEFARDVIEYLREALFLKIEPSLESDLVLGLTGEEKEKLLSIASAYSEQDLKLIIEKFMEAENKMKYASIIQLPLELAVVDVCYKNQ